MSNQNLVLESGEEPWAVAAAKARSVMDVAE